MSNYSRILHHLDMKDVKKRHLKERAAKKIEEEKNKKETKAIPSWGKLFCNERRKWKAKYMGSRCKWDKDSLKCARFRFSDRWS